MVKYAATPCKGGDLSLCAGKGITSKWEEIEKYMEEYLSQKMWVQLEADCISKPLMISSENYVKGKPVMECITSEQAKQLWEDFGDVPFDGENEVIEDNFMQFPAGTKKEDIWHYFDKVYEGGVYELLYGEDKSVQDHELSFEETVEGIGSISNTAQFLIDREPLGSADCSNSIVGSYFIDVPDITEYIDKAYLADYVCGEDFQVEDCKLYISVHETGDTSLYIHTDDEHPSLFLVEDVEDSVLEAITTKLMEAIGAESKKELIGNTAAQYTIRYNDAEIIDKQVVNRHDVRYELKLPDQDVVYALETTSLVLNNPYETAAEWAAASDPKVYLLTDPTSDYASVAIEIDGKSAAMQLTPEETKMITELAEELKDKTKNHQELGMEM